MSRALDAAYQALGHVHAALDEHDHGQQAHLDAIEQREKELQAKRADAENSADQQAIAEIDAELEELTRAWRVATDPGTER